MMKQWWFSFWFAMMMMGSGAWAGPQRVFLSEKPSPIQRFKLTLEQGQSVKLWTFESSPGAVPLLRVWEHNTRAEISSDVYGGTGLEASLTFVAPRKGDYIVFVHAYLPTPYIQPGAGDVTSISVHIDADKGGFPYVLASSIPLSGSAIHGNWVGTNTFYTVHPPGGNKDTQLMLIGCNGKLQAWDDDSGGGNKTARATGSSICQVFIGSIEAGAAHLYINDAVHGVTDPTVDGDGDGLGQALEAQLKTCDPLHKNDPGYTLNYCDLAGVSNPQDSDRDGLTDFEEVLGLPGLPLPSWGANPRNKDVFVHVIFLSKDYPPGTNSQPTHPFLVTPGDTETFATTIRDIYASGKPYDLRNPNGSSGVNIHMDLGIAPTDGTLQSLYGRWGGKQRLTLSDLEQACLPTEHKNKAYCTNMVKCLNQTLLDDDGKTIPGKEKDPSRCHKQVNYAFAGAIASPLRRGRFHFALARPGGGGTGDRPGTTFHFGTDGLTSSSPASFAHELGHNLGLEHSGHHSWGQVQCKPHYHSLMNYLYSYTKPYQFSQETYTSSLAATHVQEEDGLFTTVSGLAPGTPAPSMDFLAESGLEFLSMINADGKIAIDWSRNGVYRGSYRTPLNFPLKITGCETAGVKKDLLVSGNDKLSATPALRRDGDELYAFFIDNGALKVKRAQIGTHSSCQQVPLISNNDPCLSWQQTETIFTTQSVRHFEIKKYKGHWLLAYTSTQDQLRTKVTQKPLTGGSFAGLTWNAEELVEDNVTQGPALAWVPVNSTLYGASEVFALYWLDPVSRSYRRRIKMTPTGAWSTAKPLQTLTNSTPATLEPILGKLAATVIHVGGWGICGAFTNLKDEVQFYCRKTSDETWLDVTQTWWNQSWNTRPVSTGRPALAFRRLRQGNNGKGQPGSTIDDAQAQLYFVIHNGTTAPKTFISNVVKLDTSFHPDQLQIIGGDHTHSQWLRLKVNSNVALLDDGSATLGGLKGLWMREKDKELFLEYLPLFDGAFYDPQRDGNDFRVIELGICMALHKTDKTFCAPYDSSQQGYVGAWNLKMD